jgi:mannan endo-1,4-beta-mannosidase
MIRRLMLLACMACVAACSSPLAWAPAKNSPSPHPAAVAPAVIHGPLVGVYEPTFPASYAAGVRFGTLIGSPPPVALYYSGWGTQFQTAFAAAAWQHHASVFVQMEPYRVRLRGIVAGRYDAYLRSYADQVAAFGHPVILSFAHEMNGWWYPWGFRHVSPATWVAAWRHVVTVFRQQGAANAIWVWTVNRTQPNQHAVPIHAYWPGSSYVTWVGIDSYYYNRQDTFASILAPTIQEVRRFTGKPILLAEAAAGQLSGQVTKITDLFAGIARYHLLGAVWFDKAQHLLPYHQDWRLEGHPAAIAAFRKGVQDMEGAR